MLQKFQNPFSLNGFRHIATPSLNIRWLCTHLLRDNVILNKILKSFSIISLLESKGTSSIKIGIWYINFYHNESDTLLTTYYFTGISY